MNNQVISCLQHGLRRCVQRACLSVVMLIAMATATSMAQASVFLFQWDDAEPVLTGNTYQDGVLIQSVAVGNESYGSSYGLWNGAVLLANVDVRANIYETDGVTLSDTWHIFGTARDTFTSIPFFSDIEGQTLVALSNPTLTLIENGDWQTVLEFDVSTGDHYIWQFRSEADGQVPEPSSVALLSLGLFSAALARRRVAKIQ